MEELCKYQLKHHIFHEAILEIPAKAGSSPSGHFVTVSPFLLCVLVSEVLLPD